VRLQPLGHLSNVAFILNLPYSGASGPMIGMLLNLLKLQGLGAMCAGMPLLRAVWQARILQTGEDSARKFPNFRKLEQHPCYISSKAAASSPEPSDSFERFPSLLKEGDAM
jgi:hypothetical protein